MLRTRPGRYLLGRQRNYHTPGFIETWTCSPHCSSICYRAQHVAAFFAFGRSSCGVNYHGMMTPKSVPLLGLLLGTAASQEPSKGFHHMSRTVGMIHTLPPHLCLSSHIPRSVRCAANHQVSRTRNLLSFCGGGHDDLSDLTHEQP